MLEFFLTAAVILGIIGTMIFLAVRRGLQMRELCEHGVETTGVIFSRRSVTSGKAASRHQKLAYRYQDSAGASHEHTSIVPQAQYDLHENGGPIAVVYSARNPSVSAPKYLVDQCRAALGKK